MRTNTATIPPLRHYIGEARIVADWARGRRAENALARRYSGDGRTVMVLPGLFTTDNRTAMLRRVLSKAGYNTHGWGLGRNMPIDADILNRVDRRIRELGKDRVTLIGWSLGGIIAREYAKFAPDNVEQVITLGSPFSGGPRDNRAWRIYELVADHKVDAPPLETDRAQKPPVPTTAIWSPRDGIIAEHSARGLDGERDAEVEIRCGHLALTCAPDAMEAVLRVLQGRNGAATS